MTVKNWSVGEVLTAADLNAWAVPLAVRKASATSRVSTATPSADPDLFLTVAANAVYKVELGLAYDADAGGDLKFQFSVPSGTMTLVHGSWLSGTAALFTDDQVVSEVIVPVTGGVGAGTAAGVLGNYILAVGSTAGTLALQWAQGTSSATATILHANSYLIARRIG